MSSSIVQGVDAVDIIKFINSKNKRMQASFLSELEKLFDKDSKEFSVIRKLYLDNSNGFKRAVLSSIFGSVEDD